MIITHDWLQHYHSLRRAIYALPSGSRSPWNPFRFLLNIKMCLLHLNSSKLRSLSMALHIPLKTPSNRHSLMTCNLLNCHKTIIGWFWQAGFVLEIMSQTYMQESPSESPGFSHVPIGPAHDLFCLLDFAWKTQSQTFWAWRPCLLRPSVSRSIWSLQFP